MRKRGVDSSYNEYSATVGGSKSELTKLRIENQDLQALLNEHLLKIALQTEEDDTEASSTQWAVLPKNNPPPNSYYLSSSWNPQWKPISWKNEGRSTANSGGSSGHTKAKCFWEVSTKDISPKTWARFEKAVDSTITGKAILHTPRDLARKSLGE